MTQPPKDSEPFLVQWRNGKLVKVEPSTAPAPDTDARNCGHPSAATRSCPERGQTCTCCQRCFAECALDAGDDEEWH